LGSKTLKALTAINRAYQIIFTDYLDFHFYKDGEFITKIAIAEIENGTIKPHN
jgi:DNA-directed RNA polymerase subunit K/omega